MSEPIRPAPNARIGWTFLTIFALQLAGGGAGKTLERWAGAPSWLVGGFVGGASVAGLALSNGLARRG